MPCRSSKERRPFLTLTGFTCNASENGGFSTRYKVRVGDREVLPKQADFILLVDLVVAAVTTVRGYKPADAVKICHLRDRLEEGLGPKGRRLIEPVGNGQYRLVVDPSAIALHASFFELPDDIVSAQVKGTLREKCRLVE